MADIQTVAKNPTQQAILDEIASQGNTQQSSAALSPTAKNSTQQAILDEIKANNPSMLYDVTRGAASGLTEGGAFLAGTPRMLGDLAGQAGNFLMEKAGVPEDYRESIGNAVHTAIDYTPMTNILTSGPQAKGIIEGMSNLTGGYTEYDPKTFLGKAVKSTGVLAPTAAAIGLTGGLAAVPTAIATGAVLPGVLGTAAGEGTELVAKKFLGASEEDAARLGNYAKIGTEILTPLGAGKLLGISKNVATPQALEAEKNLIQNGVKPPTTGQILQDPKLMAREASSPFFQDAIEAQQKSLMDFAYKEAGWTGKSIPTRSQFDAFRNQAGQDMTKSIMAVPNYDVPPSLMSRILDPQLDRTVKSLDPNTSADFSKLLDDLSYGHFSPEKIDSIRKKAGELYRSDIASQHPIVKETAQKIGDISDEIILNNLQRKLPDGGRNYAAYKDKRTKYANILALGDAVEMSGRPSAMVFSPQNLYEAARNIGASSDKLKSVARDAVSFFTNHPRVSPFDLVETGMGVAGDAINAAKNALAFNPKYAAGQFGSNFLSRMMGLTHPFTMTKAGQSSIRNMSGPSIGIVNAAKRVAPVASMNYQQEDPRQGRKSGGRVSSHEADADQLVRAAERAKKGWSAETEPLLNQSDDAVAHALEVANRSI
jgi:hypothetical protein